MPRDLATTTPQHFTVASRAAGMDRAESPPSAGYPAGTHRPQPVPARFEPVCPEEV